MRVSLFSDCYRRRHASITLSLRVWSMITTSFIDGIRSSRQWRNTSWAWLLMLALICQLLQILLKSLIFDIMFTVLALFIVGMSTLGCIRLNEYIFYFLQVDIVNISYVGDERIQKGFVHNYFFIGVLKLFIVGFSSLSLLNNEYTSLFNCDCTVASGGPY